jgi:hypothetical protein
MVIKQNFILIIIISYLSAALFSSCESREQNTDDAFEIIKEEKMLSNDSNYVLKAMLQEPVKTKLSKNIEKPDEWTAFNIEIENKILNNEKKIIEMKKKSNSNSNLLRKVINIEKTNNDLRNQMNDYKEEVKLKWETFKSSINHDVDEINIELKTISINKKN